MDKKLKTYRVVPGTSDVYAISLVDEPAVESNFVALSKQTPKQMNFRAVDGERRIVYGTALRADFPIYRDYGGDDQFYITFGRETIMRLMTKFMSNFSQKNWTSDHWDYVEGLTVVESWLVEDDKNDKAVALGLENFGAGDWLVGVKIDNDEVWREIKEGRWKGFSVEAWCDFEEIEKEIKQQKHNTVMAKKKVKAEDVVVSDSLLDNIKGIIADAINAGEGQDEEQVEETAQAAAEEVAEQVETEVNEAPAEETVEASEETPAEEPEAIAEEAIAAVEETTETPEEAQEDLQAVVDRLNEEIKAKDEEIAELKKKNAKMAKQPSAKPVNVKAGAQNEKKGVAGAFASLKAMGIIR